METVFIGAPFSTWNPLDFCFLFFGEGDSMTTIRYHVTVGVFFLVSLMAFGSAMESSHLKTPEARELEVTSGGACYYCDGDDGNYCFNVGKPCGPTGGGTYRYVVPGNITQKFCRDADKYNPTSVAGKKSCVSVTPKVCVKTYHCTGSDCASGTCGDPSTESKPTDCDYGGSDDCQSVPVGA